MAILEDLIGQPLDEISDEELREIVTKGRIAREAESEAHFSSGKKKAGTGGKKKINIHDDVDPDDFV